MRKQALAVIMGLAGGLPSLLWSTSTSPATTQTNEFLSKITGGDYLQEAAMELADRFMPFLGTFEVEFVSLDEEVTRLLRRETRRHSRQFMERQMGAMGLPGNLSVGYLESPSPATVRSRPREKPVTFRAKVSGSRLGLSFLWRF